jgi:hypothetical protein
MDEYSKPDKFLQNDSSISNTELIRRKDVHFGFRCNGEHTFIDDVPFQDEMMLKLITLSNTDAFLIQTLGSTQRIT